MVNEIEVRVRGRHVVAVREMLAEALENEIQALRECALEGIGAHQLPQDDDRAQKWSEAVRQFLSTQDVQLYMIFSPPAPLGLQEGAEEESEEVAEVGP